MFCIRVKNVIPAKAGIQTTFLRKQETIFKEIDSCLYGKPWIPHHPPEAERNDRLVFCFSKIIYPQFYCEVVHVIGFQ